MRMPGFVFVKGDTSMADGAYPFTFPTGVPHGTYTWRLTLTEAGMPGAIMAAVTGNVSVATA